MAVASSLPLDDRFFELSISQHLLLTQERMQHPCREKMAAVENEF